MRFVIFIQNKTTWARTFANTGNTLRSLERVACSVKHNEPILLVGETGTGKTTLVQHLAVRLGVPLTVLVCFVKSFHLQFYDLSLCSIQVIERE
jgi:midasin (ATPase involved in ribosome maturation)